MNSQQIINEAKKTIIDSQIDEDPTVYFLNEVSNDTEWDFVYEIYFHNEQYIACHEEDAADWFVIPSIIK